MLVRNNVHSIAASANDDSQIRITGSYCRRHYMGLIRVVDWSGIKSTLIEHLNSFAAQVLSNQLLDAEASVVSTNGNPLGHAAKLPSGDFNRSVVNPAIPMFTTRPFPPLSTLLGSPRGGCQNQATNHPHRSNPTNILDLLLFIHIIVQFRSSTIVGIFQFTVLHRDSTTALKAHHVDSPWSNFDNPSSQASETFLTNTINRLYNNYNFYKNKEYMRTRFHWWLVLLVLCAGSARAQPTNGLTRYYFPNGAVSSEGMLVDGKPEGWWRAYHANGQLRSEGNRKAFLLDSLWRFYDEQGHLLSETSYREDKKNGESKRFDTTGVLLSEEFFENDLRTGLGRFFHADGSLHKEIPFKAGKEEGIGREFAADGRVVALLHYKAGMLRRRDDINRIDAMGLRQGPWKEFHPNGKVKLEGQYVDDRQQGIFKEFDAMGNLKEMVKFDGGRIDEKAQENLTVDIKRTFHSNGRVASIGSYSRSGKKEGLFKEFDRQGEIISARIYQSDILLSEGRVNELGVMEGPWVEYFATGEKRAEGSYKEGRKDGDWTYYHRSGKVEQRGKFMNGSAHGQWQWYYESGSLHREELYRKGKEDGRSVEYDEEGRVITQGEYVDGRREGKWTYDVGDHREEGSYKDGLKEGTWVFYYDTGKRFFQGDFIQGEPNGRHRWYWPNGKLKLEGRYVMGIEQGDFTHYLEDGTISMVIRFKDGAEVRIDGQRVPPPYVAGEPQP